ncbi:hypothetical protein [Ancylobacter amanitiformis]|uniref:Lipid-binding transport protein (Tim44 family) n=1 Tax=Ancylobacter amanitiformis TaxID=217069 RepID=A0ABU0LRY6_9HYPH|nr:hypothetical protein [Ancylobacter amanitiformis]MDQ0511410.1 putative lipid-binding transport protein (Tim44 family) [Ancylobacter amanitiformis]
MDKREPTLQEFMSSANAGRHGTAARPSPASAPGAEPATGPATSAASRTAGTAAARKGPPEDPEAFHRWVEIERLKVDMRRLEIENRRLVNETRRPDAAAGRRPELARAHAPGLTAGIAASVLLLVVMLALGLFQAVTLNSQLTSLQDEVASLRMAFAALEDKVADIPAAPPVATASASPPAAAPAPAPAPAAAPTPAPAPAEPEVAAAPPKPSGPGAGYIVRVFAPTGSVPAAKVDQFTSALKAAGFEVLISDAGVANPTSNTLSFNPSAEAMAKKLAALVQAKRPALSLEVRSSPSIPDSARNILILTVTEDALR